MINFSSFFEEVFLIFDTSCLIFEDVSLIFEDIYFCNLLNLNNLMFSLYIMLFREQYTDFLRYYKPHSILS